MKKYKVSHAEMAVFIAEDGTSVVDRIEYNRQGDCLTGFSAPLNENTGLPRSDHFKATTMSSVQHYFETERDNKAKTIYALVAIPLTEKAPPYILALFGTSNSFNHNDCIKR